MVMLVAVNLSEREDWMALSASEEKTIVSLFTNLQNIDSRYYAAAYYFVSGFLRCLALSVESFEGIEMPGKEKLA